MGEVKFVNLGKWMVEGDVFEMVGCCFDVYYCLGYFFGYLVFIDKELCLVILGDVLFVGLVGCIDLLGGNYVVLI